MFTTHLSNFMHISSSKERNTTLGALISCKHPECSSHTKFPLQSTKRNRYFQGSASFSLKQSSHRVQGISALKMSLFGSDHGKAEGSHLPCRYLTCLVLVLTNHTSNTMGLNQLFVASVRRWLAASGHVRNEGLEQTDRTVLALKNADTPWDFQSPFANLTFIPFRSPVL